MDDKQQEFFEKLLKERLFALLSEAGSTIGTMTTVEDNLADSLDIATMESNRDFNLRLRSRERVLIGKIKKALRKLKEGEYGECVVCGEDIAISRLMARPVATHCIDCKTEAEQLERRSRNH